MAKEMTKLLKEADSRSKDQDVHNNMEEIKPNTFEKEIKTMNENHINEHCPNCREAARQNTYFFADKIHILSSQIPYTLHVEAAGGASDFGFQSVEKAKATADLLWNDSTAYYITITNNDTAEVMYPYEVASALPF